MLMAKRDYYEVLSVSRTASDGQLTVSIKQNLSAWYMTRLRMNKSC